MEEKKENGEYLLDLSIDNNLVIRGGGDGAFFNTEISTKSYESHLTIRHRVRQITLQLTGDGKPHGKTWDSCDRSSCKS